MSEVLVTVKNLSKKFCKDRYLSMVYGMVDIMKSLFLFNRFCGVLRKKEFFAIENVSFDVRRGECLGVLGPNGAGKTTLLKLILGVLLPDSGRIVTSGVIAAILSKASGLSRDLTGRENIYFCCALHGKSKSQVVAILDHVVATAELGKSIDDPLKTYSVGMVARLNFAIAVNIKPDVLLLDDVLQVGDLKFFKKSEDILNRMRNDTAIIFASHNVNALLAQANKIAVLDKGKIRFFKDKFEAVDYYYKMFSGNFSGEVATENNMAHSHGISLRNSCK